MLRKVKILVEKEVTVNFPIYQKKSSYIEIQFEKEDIEIHEIGFKKYNFNSMTGMNMESNMTAYEVKEAIKVNIKYLQDLIAKINAAEIDDAFEGKIQHADDLRHEKKENPEEHKNEAEEFNL